MAYALDKIRFHKKFWSFDCKKVEIEVNFDTAQLDGDAFFSASELLTLWNFRVLKKSFYWVVSPHKKLKSVRNVNQGSNWSGSDWNSTT
jgi:hypothetical protein